uniref:NADH:ubiquinone reductase (H(+)-translocating) n=1 Tax=Metagonimus yokogawai TaxID=84529 RepID=V9NDA1_9TREM|nr:NADH dehydrogenase subunit 5 [Metagonimus yokogawai]AGN12767.1 NADH dehydrogenase subunit 5 [Metagonimus yokogawai]
MLACMGLFCLWGIFLFAVWGVSGWSWSLSFLGFLLRDVSLDLLLEDVSLVCLSMLFFCGSVALFYCFHYMGGSGDSCSLFCLMVWFLLVMCGLVVSGSVIISLVLWEYLGLVSFLLILFYSNSSSLRAALITLFASRFGDAALFLLVMWVSSWFGHFSYLVGGLVLLVVLTKSACYPFISWLLEAMRAPTPVSSLVHSSTLVAAGVWFFFRYSFLFGDGTLCLMFVLSVSTIVISGVCALFFNDLKKLVALSTCNNISWCVVFFICGDLDLALLQLLTHGVCKCYPFMSVGDLMSLSGGSQSSVAVYFSRYGGVLGVYLQTILILSLCGLPFLGVFFSKHGLFGEIGYIFGWGYLCLVFLSFVLSYAYSIRLVLVLLSSVGGLSSGYSSGYVLISVLSVLGTVVNAVGSWGVLAETSGLGCFLSGSMLLLQLGGGYLGWLMFVSMGAGSPLGASCLAFSDSVVKGVIGVYLSCSDCSVISFYRWELYLLSLRPRVVLQSSFFSFNALVFAVMVISFLVVLFGL